MKTIWKLLNNSVVLTCLLVATIFVHLISWGVWLELSKSDWGTWVGSIGTVATLAGTIWLATAETRRRERQEKVVARLRGAGMAARIENALAEVTAVSLLLELSRNGNRRPSDYAFCEGKLEAIELWTIDEITPLISLPFNTAIKLAEAVDQVQTIKRTLSRMGKMAVISTTHQRTQVERMTKLITTTINHLEDAKRECRLGAVELQLNIH